DDEARRTVRAMFDEQVAWAVAAGVDFIIGETFSWAEEAMIALEAIRASGLPAVITLAMHTEATTRDDLTPEETCVRLEEAGAAGEPLFAGYDQARLSRHRSALAEGIPGLRRPAVASRPPNATRRDRDPEQDGGHPHAGRCGERDRARRASGRRRGRGADARGGRQRRRCRRRGRLHRLRRRAVELRPRWLRASGRVHGRAPGVHHGR